MKASTKFCLIGLLVAGLEEFITQGVLKKTSAGWILPTIIAFLPFLIIVRLLGKFLNWSLDEPAAVLIYYLAAGSIGLLVEWFLIGLTPWGDPNAPFVVVLVLQLGMFSFWGSVAFAPRILLDDRDSISQIRRSYKQFLIFGLAVIYCLTFAASKEAQFLVSILAVLITFLVLNFFYFRYVRALGKLGI